MTSTRIPKGCRDYLFMGNYNVLDDTHQVTATRDIGLSAGRKKCPFLTSANALVTTRSPQNTRNPSKSSPDFPETSRNPGSLFKTPIPLRIPLGDPKERRFSKASGVNFWSLDLTHGFVKSFSGAPGLFFG